MILGSMRSSSELLETTAFMVFQLANEVPFRHRIQGRRRLWSLLSSLGIPHIWLFKKAWFVAHKNEWDLTWER
jgi:hypothetical protein